MNLFQEALAQTALSRIDLRSSLALYRPSHAPSQPVPSRLERLAFLLSIFCLVQDPRNVLARRFIVRRQVLKHVLSLEDHREVLDICEDILRVPRDGRGAERGAP